jgi:hypothetical protein
LTVDDDGVVHDLTIRSFGILRAVDTPAIHVDVQPSGDEPKPVSDAVLAAVTAAVAVVASGDGLAGVSLDGVADDWPISYAELEPYYVEAERQLGVSGLMGDPAYPKGDGPRTLPCPSANTVDA